MRAVVLASLLALTTPAVSQMLPQPGADNPRIQSVRWMPGQDILLTALPGTGLTVVLEPGEQIRRVSVDDQRALDVRVSHELDSFLVTPSGEIALGSMLVQTDRRDYRFQLRTDEGLTAAYLVKLEFGDQQAPAAAMPMAEPSGNLWRYRIRGDRSVRPAQISDDGVRTKILFGPEQALPAVFAIGPTGDEEVVNGYMRSGLFVIDRVHEELVFRIDKEKATARRNEEPEDENG